ncbi:MAG TPA: ScpA family protein [Bdellovibrionota bacterium]|nr:ScpA family protein [Bdellovibrionota bacterium]
MQNRIPITVRLESFEGPLDLLLYLIQSHELDISTVSIGRITEQYLAYVRLMRELDFDIASEFLVMASTLVLWKSKSLLPSEGDQAQKGAEDDLELSPEDLVRQLIEHQKFRAAGQSIAQLPWLGDDVFARPNPKAAIERVWKEMSFTSLATTYQDILVRARKRVKVLKKETVSLSDKIAEFKSRLKLGQMTEFISLLSEQPARPEIVVTFLASLELSRLKKLRLYQEATYGPILLELIESIRDFDAAQAIGFEMPQGEIKALPLPEAATDSEIPPALLPQPEAMPEVTQV